MGLIVKEEGVRMPPVAEGVHPAVCYRLYDLGTHYQEKFDKRIHQCLIAWELPEERIEVDRDGTRVDLPRVISKTYTMSLHEKALLRQHLQSWRGKAFTDEELTGFDITKLLGVNCMIQVIHNKVDNKVYGNVTAILPLHKGLPKRKPKNTTGFFSLQENMDIPEDTPDWIKSIIHESEEWQARDTETPDKPDDDDGVPF